MTVTPTEVRLAPDRWLAEQLGREVYRLAVDELPAADVPETAGQVEALLADATGPALVYAKVPVAAVTLAGALERAGFNLIDTSLTLERPRFERSEPAPGVVRAARAADEGVVVALARCGFSRSRFHLDPAIGAETADEIKAQWVANFFRGRRGDVLAVATRGERIVGFLLALVAADGALVIDLVAVDREHRGRGIAADLTRFAEARLPAAAPLRVGTQIANDAALRAYQKIGFTVVRSAYVFHRHLS